ncbi:MAG: DMT family transporter [Bacteroidales bacterium]|nr:DMT family transporter [Bacteroidales bacterium]
MKNAQLAGHLAGAGAYAIFGLNIIICKDIALADVISPIALFTLRAAGASTLFWLLSLLLPKEKMPLSDILKTGLASFLGLFVPQLTFLSAIRITTSIDTALFTSLTPIWTMFVAAIFLREPISWKKVSGVALSFTGAIILIFNSVHEGGASTTSPLGLALLLLNTLSFALYLGIFRPLISRYSVVTFMKWSFLWSLAISIPLSVKDLLHTDFAAISPQIGAEIGFLIVFATCIAYFLIPFAQKRIRPTIVSLYSYLQPLIACAVSVMIGMDVFTWQKAVSTLCVFAGVWLVNKSRAAAR